MTTDYLPRIKTVLVALAPAGWRYRVTTKANGYVVLTISAAPVDLVAVNLVGYPNADAKGYVKVCPTAYEDPWCEASAVIGAMWKLLLLAPRRELWIGTPSKPFAVMGK